MNVLERIRRPRSTKNPGDDERAVEFLSTWKDGKLPVGFSFKEYVQEGLNGTPIVAALIAARVDVYADIDFFWRDRTTKKPLRDTPGLRGLRNPWPGGNLADLLALTELDVQLAGSSYVERVSFDDWEFARRRPDWMWVIGRTGERPGIEGFVFKRDGETNPNQDGRIIERDRCAQLLEMPEPLAANLGRSWIRACLLEVNADQAASRFVNAYFDNAATPNLIIKAPRQLGVEQRKELAGVLNRRYTGSENAFKTLLLENGAEAMVVGSDLAAVEYSTTRAAGETRIAAAAGVAPIVAGLREGLQAGTYSNYGQAVRKTLDWKIRPRWKRTAHHFQAILDPPNRNAELWYDDSQISAVQQDALDDAEIKGKTATTINTLITAGFTPEAVAEAVQTGDFTTLTHTGLFSVQLQPPGTMFESDTTDSDDDPIQFDAGETEGT